MSPYADIVGLVASFVFLKGGGMEFGAVKRFFKKSGFGIIVGKRGKEEILLNVQDGEMIELDANGNGPQFSGVELKRQPSQGDEVCFERIMAQCGFARAIPWGFAEDYCNLLSSWSEPMPELTVVAQIYEVR